MCVAGYPYPSEHGCKDTAYFDRLLQLHKAYRISDYIGRIQAVSKIRTSRDATSNRIHQRIIDIQNLSGNAISLALWHDMAVNFNLQEYEVLERPVVIAVSSCWVRRFHGLQLFSTSTTHYYLNPNIPETFHIKQVHQQLPEPQVMLNIDNQRYENPEEEKTRNQFPLATLFDLDPQNYEQYDKTTTSSSHGVRFTSEASIYKINTQKKWYYQRCASCGKQVISGDPFPTCKNHGPQPTPVYRTTKSNPSFEPTAAPISKNQPEAIQHTKPLSPALSTTASNQPEVVEPKTAEIKEPQSTPLTTPETMKPIKGDQQINLLKASARKSLFKTKPEADTLKGKKKSKHDK
ncbi:DNA helicase [Tanacetum coccineum]